jgi:outer membrane immunogenic protein
MKKVMLGGVALITLGFVGAAVAADMPVKAPPPVLVNTWTGFYAGVDFGAIRGANESESFSQGPGFGAGGATAFDPTTMNSTNHWGGIGGVYGGYNWAVTPSWVIGIEGDWNKANLGNSNTATLTSGGVSVPGPAGAALGCLNPVAAGNPTINNTCNSLTMSDNLSWIATVRGRLGYTYGSMMLYGTGGVAWMNQELSGAVNPCTTPAGITPAVGPPPVIGTPGSRCNGGNGVTALPNLNSRVASIATSQNQTSEGWVLGGGIEVMATANWLVRIEYLHYAFGTGTTHSAACSLCVAGVFSGAGNFSWNSASYDSIRAGLAYKF